MARGDLRPLQVDGPQASAAMIRRILDGEPGRPRTIVVLNAAAALWTAGSEFRPAVCAHWRRSRDRQRRRRPTADGLWRLDQRPDVSMCRGGRPESWHFRFQSCDGGLATAGRLDRKSER